MIVAVVALIGVSSCGAGHQSATSASRFRFSNATAQGTLIAVSSRKPAAPMTGTLIGGGSYSLAAHRGRVVLLNFWASWCAPCVSESPMLEQVSQVVQSKGVDFVGIDIKDDRQSAQGFISEKAMTYPMIYDEAAKAALELDIPSGGLPVTVLIDRAGRVAAVYLGAVQRGEIVPALQSLAAERA